MEIQEITTSEASKGDRPNYRLEMKPYEGKHGDKCKILEITDITLHSTQKRPSSIRKKVKKAFKDDSPGRIYSPIEQGGDVRESAVSVSFLEQYPDFVRTVQEEQEKGYKVLIKIPSDGIPILVGKDTKEFFKSKNGKRIIRKRVRN